MGAATVFLVATVLFFIAARLMRITSQPESPTLYFKKNADGAPSAFIQMLLETCPVFTQTYVPPWLWGRSGHLQTLVHSTFGRNKAPDRKGDIRHSVMLADGSTLTFDVFEPSIAQPSDEEYTVLVCPGIGNSSETVAIRTFAHYLTLRGYRVAVLNHLGVIKTIPLTAPRIFTMGSTEEYGAMVDEVRLLHPQSKLIAVGFSMGANLILKYLGEDKARQQQFLCAVSACQGYTIQTIRNALSKWVHLRKAYLMAMTYYHKRILHHFRHILFGREAQEKYGPLNEAAVLSSTLFPEIDELFTRKMAGFSDLNQFYEWCSSSNYIGNINIPMLLINAEDDPLVPDYVFETPRSHAERSDQVLFVTTKHGGHLGYFESSSAYGLIRETFNWLDKAVAQYIGGIVLLTTTAAAARQRLPPLAGTIVSSGQ